MRTPWLVYGSVVKKDTKVTVGPSPSGLGLGLIATSK